METNPHHGGNSKSAKPSHQEFSLLISFLSCLMRLCACVVAEVLWSSERLRLGELPARQDLRPRLLLQEHDDELWNRSPEKRKQDLHRGKKETSALKHNPERTTLNAHYFNQHFDMRTHDNEDTGLLRRRVAGRLWRIRSRNTFSGLE